MDDLGTSSGPNTTPSEPGTPASPPAAPPQTPPAPPRGAPAGAPYAPGPQYGQQYAPGPQYSQYPPPAPGQYTPSYGFPPKKKMSTGAKWAIGLLIAFVVLTCGSCVIFAALLGSTGDMTYGDSVCVIHIDGVIQGGGDTWSNGSPEYILDQLDQALADDSVKAIILRIDSPGGTVAASQEIALAVERATQQKPVVVSVGDICASGGYMVASQADEIIASPGSSVGSIGVIMDVPNVQGLLDKVGISFTTLTSGQYKDAGSPFRELTEEEKVLLNEQLNVVYEQFITDVAEGRGMDEADVRELATGWVWLGSEAIDLGLVDSLGNYDDAVARAGELGGIEGTPNVVSFEYVDPFTQFFSSLYGVVSESNQLDAETLRRGSLPR